ncbi:class I SAM-dependent methyltransferase [Brassicibacter mesophilus]|uniref:class I SAM-dependent methyltransferase n=1 Tax=Brassicibacter mesophilus TaxID=745119 RepID=UPI003D2071FD
MEKLESKLSDVSGGKVLDVATRYGEFALKLKEGLKDYDEIIAIDNSQEVVNTAIEKHADSGVKFIHMDGSNLDFKDETFDIVCISNSLHHVTDINKVLSEMKRVLKPGGIFIVNEMFNDNQSDAQNTHVLLHHLGGEIDTLLGEYHGKTLKKQEIVDIVKEAGINVEDIFEDYETDPELAKKLATKIEKLDKKVEKTKEYDQYEEFKRRTREVKESFNKSGIERCTQLVVMGRK